MLRKSLEAFVGVFRLFPNVVFFSLKNFFPCTCILPGMYGTDLTSGPLPLERLAFSIRYP